MTVAPIDNGAIARGIDALAAAWAVPGGVVVVTDRTGTVFEHAFGWADIERGIAASVDRLFQIGSISKIFTATVVLQLVEEGTLRLDQSAGQVLDWLPPMLAGPELTLERLLGHRAGLVSGVDAVPDQVAQVASFTGRLSSAPPGEYFHYSNLGFILLGLVAEKVLGMTLAQAINERILTPLKLAATVSRITNSEYSSMARGYRALDDDRFWLPGDKQIVAPWLEVDGADGALAMTAEELAVFVRMLLSEGHDLGIPNLFETMTTTFAPGGEDTVALAGLEQVDTSRYGLGINVELSGSRTALSHGGGMVGYASFVLADLDAGVGVVVLTNSNGVGPIAEVIARAVSGAVTNSTAIAPLVPDEWAVEGSDPAIRPRPIDAAMFGSFRARHADGSDHAIVVGRRDGPGGSVLVDIQHSGTGDGGESSPLLWSWGEGVGTRHPHFRQFAFQFDGRCWLWGPDSYLPNGDDAPNDLGQAPAEFCGHFRTYSPWFPNFRIVDRAGALVMISAPAVESPGDEVPLAETAPGVYRIGSDPRLPEHLTFGPLVDGLAAWVDRDGCRYSRSFLD